MTHPTFSLENPTIPAKGLCAPREFLAFCHSQFGTRSAMREIFNRPKVSGKNWSDLLVEL